MNPPSTSTTTQSAAAIQGETRGALNSVRYDVVGFAVGAAEGAAAAGASAPAAATIVARIASLTYATTLTQEAGVALLASPYQSTFSPAPPLVGMPRPL